jgi:hypothetical protein
MPATGPYFLELESGIPDSITFDCLPFLSTSGLDVNGTSDTRVLDPPHPTTEQAQKVVKHATRMGRFMWIPVLPVDLGRWDEGMKTTCGACGAARGLTGNQLPMSD